MGCGVKGISRNREKEKKIGKKRKKLKLKRNDEEMKKE